jgi:hypothetical protein
MRVEERCPARLASSLAHPLAVLLLLGHSIRDGLMGGGAFGGVFDEGFGCLHVAGFDERFRFVLGADVVGWPHTRPQCEG